MKEPDPIIKKHFKNPQNAGVMKDYNCSGKDSSLHSGTTTIFYALIENGLIKDISFRTFGCSYSIAASSLITTQAKNKIIVAKP